MVRWFDRSNGPSRVNIPCNGFLIDLSDLYVVGVKVTLDGGGHRVYAVGKTASEIGAMQSALEEQHQLADNEQSWEFVRSSFEKPQYVKIERGAGVHLTSLHFDSTNTTFAFENGLRVARNGTRELNPDKILGRAVLQAAVVISEAARFSAVEQMVIAAMRAGSGQMGNIRDLLTDWTVVSAAVARDESYTFEGVEYRNSAPGTASAWLNLVRLIKPPA
jgi:Ribosome inactivating protein